MRLRTRNGVCTLWSGANGRVVPRGSDQVVSNGEAGLGAAGLGAELAEDGGDVVGGGAAADAEGGGNLRLRLSGDQFGGGDHFGNRFGQRAVGSVRPKFRQRRHAGLLFEVGDGLEAGSGIARQLGVETGVPAAAVGSGKQAGGRFGVAKVGQ